MAEFDIALPIILKNEGLYSNNPLDSGEETICGISRKFHPNWRGWIIVDDHKKLNDFPENIIENNKFHILVYEFYKENYWNKLLCDKIKEQNIANKFFDMTVNIGFKTIRFMQRAICDVIRNERKIRTFVFKLDGLMGPMTLDAINSVDQDELLNKFKNICVDYYKSKNNPTFEKGWIKRALS